MGRRQQRYFFLAKELERKHPGFNFKDHCYWRMANDFACKSQWSLKVERPYYKNCTEKQLDKSIQIMEYMLLSTRNIMRLHRISMKLRRFN